MVRGAQAGKADTLSLLVDKGGAVNSQTVDGWTALMFGSLFGHEQVVKVSAWTCPVTSLLPSAQQTLPTRSLKRLSGEQTEQRVLSLSRSSNVELACRL